MKIRIFIILFLLIIPFFSKGQEYSVESFEILPNDLTARTDPRIDSNGRKCGVIKIYVKDEITEVCGSAVGHIVDKGFEKRVYVSHDIKQIELYFKEHMPLRVAFDDFNFTTLYGNMTYVLKLKEAETSNSSIAAITDVREQGTPPSRQTSAYTCSDLTDYEQASITNPMLISGEHLDPVDPIIRNLINNMVYVEGGSFMMGSEDSEIKDSEKPMHCETVGSFSIGKYEVTQKEWMAVMGNNPSKFQGDNLPVERVSWYDCQEFIQKLNSITGLTFRLPTEEEWEYAARGGNLSKSSRFSGSNDDINMIAWYNENSGCKTHNVGTKCANELGLHDMNGNVWEWTSTNWNSHTKKKHKTPGFVTRGGSWYFNARLCRISSYYDIEAASRSFDLGLRLAL